MNINIPGYMNKKDLDEYIHYTFLREQLDYERSVGKRLDEHREYSQAILESGVFNNKPWHIKHLATQDDYLMRLYFLRHAIWPPELDDLEEKSRCPVYSRCNDLVRARPKAFGRCGLPEFVKEKQESNPEKIA